MVGYNPEREKKFSNLTVAIAGGASGAITRFLCQPFDVVKIRFQLQTEPLKKHSPGSKYFGIYQCFKTMLTEEGIKSLWKGHIPAQCLSISYGFCQFSVFEFLTRQAWKHLPALSNDFTPVLHFACGGLSGCMATVVAMPFDVVRTRLVGQGEPKIYKGMFNGFYTMCTTEGPKALYKGLSPALLQIIPYTGIQFGAYTYISMLRNKLNGLKFFAPLGFFESLTSGMAAGLIAKVLVYPLDLLKKRLQIQGFENARIHFGKVKRYTGLINCILTMRKEEGFSSFYKGLSPSLIKAALTTGINFALYETISQMIENSSAES